MRGNAPARLFAGLRAGGRRRFRSRRGAMVMYLGVFFTTTVVLGALTFDFARLSNLKAELQNSADAAAHAGATRIVQGGCTSFGDWVQIRNETQTFALVNLAMQGTVTVDSNLVGDWDPVSRTFLESGSCIAGIDGVRIVVSRQSSGLFMSLLGVSAPQVRAAATGYVCPVLGSPPTCAIARAVLVR